MSRQMEGDSERGRLITIPVLRRKRGRQTGRRIDRHPSDKVSKRRI